MPIYVNNVNAHKTVAWCMVSFSIIKLLVIQIIIQNTINYLQFREKNNNLIQLFWMISSPGTIIVQKACGVL